MKGRISVGIFKVMAVVSALAIGGGYVAWRHGESKKAMAEQAEAKEKGEREKLLGEVDEAWQEEVKELELMPGSKNPVREPLTRKEIDEYLEKGRDFIHPIPGIPEGAEDVSNVTPMLPGSKSISMPLFTKDQIKELRARHESGKEVEIVPEDLLPSSKIGILRLPKMEVEPPEEKATKLLPGSKSFLVIPKEPESEKSE